MWRFFLPLHFTLYTFYSSLITHSLYLILRILLLVPYIYTPCQRPRMNQRRTKDEPKNAKSQNVRFIKIAVSFSSYTLPNSTDRRAREDREDSDSSPRLPKVTFVKIANLKKLSPILKRLTLFLKKLTHFLKMFPFFVYPDDARLRHYGVLDEPY